MPPSELIQTVLLVMVCLTDKIHGSALTLGDQSPSSPSGPALVAKRHSTPEHHLRPPPTVESCPPNHRHSVDDALLHYSDNINRCSRSSSGVFDSTGNSRRESVEPALPIEQYQNRDSTTRSKDHVVGKIAFGFGVRNSKTKTHWEKMIRGPRTIASEWHNLN